MSAGEYMYPVPKLDSVKLEYPFGTADIQEITDADFDSEIFAKIPHFIYSGGQDANPGLLDYDASGRKGWATTMHSILGKDRKEIDQQYAVFLKNLGMDVTFIFRDDLGHSPDDKVMQEMHKFLDRVKQ